MIANLGSAVVFGSIFWKLGMGQSHINDRIGLLQVRNALCIPANEFFTSFVGMAACV